jgi:hypothetical protein
VCVRVCACAYALAFGVYNIVFVLLIFFFLFFFHLFLFFSLPYIFLLHGFISYFSQISSRFRKDYMERKAAYLI